MPGFRIFKNPDFRTNPDEVSPMLKYWWPYLGGSTLQIRCGSNVWIYTEGYIVTCKQSCFGKSIFKTEPIPLLLLPLNLPWIDRDTSSLLVEQREKVYHNTAPNIWHTGKGAAMLTNRSKFLPSGPWIWVRKFDEGNEAPTLQCIHKSAAKIQMGKTLYLLADTDKRNNIDVGAPVLAHRESTAMLTRETLTLWPMEMKAAIFRCLQTRRSRT